VKGHLAFGRSIAEAVRDAGFVQESAPEQEGLKRRILAEVDAHARPDALVCSSTSGLLPSRLQADMARPERLMVGHPFNPVYLLPLVEVCGGEKTAPEHVDRAVTFYRSIGMRPLRIRKEVDGFVADRLLEALWREALWLVHDDIATVEDVDDAIRFGAGLRWALMGTFMVYRIAGGEGGMRHFMTQFGPALKWPWTKLTDVPELTGPFLDKIAVQSDAQAGGLSIRELERKRDDCLVAILQALKTQQFAAGEVLRAYEERLHHRPHGAAARLAPDAPSRHAGSAETASPP
jgi:carnitine 3-dehydrogenase